MSDLHFGTGYLTVINSDGLPVQVGVLKDITLSESGTVKTLYGQRRFAIDAGGGEIKLTGKAKHAAFSAGLMASLISDMSSASGCTVGVFDEAGTIPGDTAYTITVTNHTTWTTDLGVWNITTQSWMTPGDAVAEGVYTVADGVYTFDVSNKSQKVSIFYDYTLTSGVTYTTTSNPLMGALPTFGVKLFNEYEEGQTGVYMRKCVFSKVDIAAKNNDHNEEDIEFEAIYPTDGNPIIEHYTSNAR